MKGVIACGRAATVVSIAGVVSTTRSQPLVGISKRFSWPLLAISVAEGGAPWDAGSMA